MVFWDYQNIDASWDANYKGYYFENSVKETLERNGFDYLGNPSSFRDWKAYTIPGFDLKVKGWKIECKFSFNPVYHSWFMRDWYTRNCDIIVTNYKYNVSYEDRSLLKSKNVRLMDLMELVCFLLDGNKRSLNISLNISLDINRCGSGLGVQCGSRMGRGEHSQYLNCGNASESHKSLVFDRG